MNRIQKARLKLNQKLETHEKEIPCFYEDPNLFDPDMYDDYHTRQAAIKSAKALCGECPARVECFDYGYKSSASAMMWGGATVQEINHIKYRQK